MASKKTSTGGGKIASDDILQIWKQAIETQMHFNELSIKTRQMGMTIVGAVLAFAVVSYDKINPITIKYDCSNLVIPNCTRFEVPMATILCLAAAWAMLLIGALDIGFYHRLLRGSVKFNEELEANHLNLISGTSLGLTQRISESSRVESSILKWIGIKKEAGSRLKIFYRGNALALTIVAIALLIAKNWR